MSEKKFTSTEKINPFPGLRPFRTDEAHLFFGRRKQADDVVGKIISNRFCAVTGASGSGKSSLIFCGVITALHQIEASSEDKWHTIVSRPGHSPMSNLLNSLKKTSKYDYDPQLESPQDIVTHLKKIYSGKNDKILIIIDQFEEIFRFSLKETVNKIDAPVFFTRALTELVNQKELSVYIIITMRSDFIGECSQFLQLTSLINSSNYLVPRMTRNDFREVIEGPINIAGAKIQNELVDKMLEDLGDNPDQLPVLQHALMRTWNYWELHNERQKPLAISDYDAIGRIEKALSEHANEAFGELSEKGKEVCERIFRTLTEKGSDNKGVRKPVRVEKLIEITQASPEDVYKVLDTFRMAGRSFITPSIEIPISENSVIDISHESFMRIWDRLKTWVDEEAAAIVMYKRLAESAFQFQSGISGLWRPPDLQLALNWKKKTKPTLAWAERHDPAFERTIVFLDASEKDYVKEEENKLRTQKRQLRMTRLFAMVLGSAAIVALGLFIWTRELQVTAEKESQRAETQRLLAEAKTTEAQHQSEKAEKAALEADEQRKVAEYQTQIAERERLEAERMAAEARKQTDLANTQRILALKNEKDANEQKDQAEIQKQLAEKAREEAFQRRMLTTARSMAVKSLQASNDPDLSALLAYQAFDFNSKYAGQMNDVDIYSGLYQALKVSLGNNFNVYAGHNDAVRSVHFIPGTNTFISAGNEGRILKWDVDDETKKFTSISEGRNLIEQILVSPDGELLICAENNAGITLFNLKNENLPPITYRGSDPNIRTMAVTPDSKNLFTAGTSGSIDYWELKTGEYKQFANTPSKINTLALSPDGVMLASGTNDGKIVLWKTKGETSSINIYKDSLNPVQCLAFAPDYSYLTAGTLKGEILIFNTSNFELLRTLSKHKARITELSFSPDGKTLASSSFDSNILFWNMLDLTSPPIQLEDHSGFAFTVAFNSDGKHVVSGSSEGSRLISRPAYSNLLADHICRLVKRNFTEEEWNIYVGTDIPYEKTCKPIAGMSIEIRK
jgi:hypothetical protein